MKQGWEVKKLGEVCAILDNLRKPITKKDRIDGEYPYYGATGILSYVHNFIFDEKLVLIGEDGAKWASGDNTAFIVDGKYWVNNHAHVIRPNREIILDEWIVYFLNFSDLTKYITGMTVPKLNQEKMRSIEIPLPPLPEQQKIVAILDEAFAAIERAKANAALNLKNAKELFDAYLQSVFENRGEGWEEKKLGEVCEMINRGISPKYTENNGLIVLNQKCIRNHEISFEKSRFHDGIAKKVSPEKMVRFGDVLINSTGTGTLGRVAQVRDELQNVTVDSHVTIVRPIPDLFYIDFFGWALIFIEEEIAKRGEGCGGQTELARNTLKNDFTICYPTSQTEQKSIVQKLDLLSAETKRLEAIYQQKIDNLEELKKTILQKAFNGEL